MRSTTLKISHVHRACIFWTLVAISILSFGIYIYSINATARQTALGQNFERQNTEKAAELDALEFAYIDLKNSVTIELAHNYGFKEVKSPLYVSRSSNFFAFIQ